MQKDCEVQKSLRRGARNKNNFHVRKAELTKTQSFQRECMQKEHNEGLHNFFYCEEIYREFVSL